MKNLLKCKLLVLLLVMVFPISSYSQTESTKIRIGVFDSRCVAMAYGRTDLFNEIKQMHDELKNAKELKDSVRVKELEALGPAKQKLIHLQVFGNGSIGNIIEKKKNEIQSIAKNNNISVVTSKWELVFMNESLERVDLTDKIVELFNPNEETLKMIEDMKTQNPVSLEELLQIPSD